MPVHLLRRWLNTGWTLCYITHYLTITSVTGTLVTWQGTSPWQRGNDHYFPGNLETVISKIISFPGLCRVYPMPKDLISCELISVVCVDFSAVSKKQKMFLPHPRVKVSIVGSLRDREVACSASDRQGSNFGSCVWRTVSSQSSHHPQEVLLAQFSLYVHKGGLKPDSFHFLSVLIIHAGGEVGKMLTFQYMLYKW